jgi:HAD superfamily hydrolase (TIGR01549 family)
MKPEILIFDLDGTIVDSKKVYYSTMIRELGFLGYTEKDVSKAIDRGLSLRKTLGHLGLNFITRLYLHYRIMGNVKKYVNKIKKCRNISSLEKIKTKKILVTNSVDDFALKVLKHLKIKKYFSEIYGADDFSDKAEFIKKYINKNTIHYGACYYIGDRVADVNVARKCRIRSVIIANWCSWDSRKELLKAKPDYIMSDLSGLLKIFGAS